jgi:hypothetical protein
VYNEANGLSHCLTVARNAFESIREHNVHVAYSDLTEILLEWGKQVVEVWKQRAKSKFRPDNLIVVDDHRA